MAVYAYVISIISDDTYQLLRTPNLQRYPCTLVLRIDIAITPIQQIGIVVLHGNRLGSNNPAQTIQQPCQTQSTSIFPRSPSSCSHPLCFAQGKLWGVLPHPRHRLNLTVRKTRNIWMATSHISVVLAVRRISV